MGLLQQSQVRAKYSRGLADAYMLAGAPTANVTLLGTAIVGSRLVDTTAGKEYICTATNGTSTITWTVVESQV